MNYTTNYHLPQWVESDRILMEDFNDAMSGIDGGIAAAQSAANNAQSTANNAQSTASAAQSAANNAYCPENKPYAIGRYYGKGETAQTITLGFKPSYLIISGQTGDSNDADKSIGIFHGQNMGNKVTLSSTGFTVAEQSSSALYPLLNSMGRTYGYIAFR